MRRKIFGACGFSRALTILPGFGNVYKDFCLLDGLLSCAPLFGGLPSDLYYAVPPVAELEVIYYGLLLLVIVPLPTFVTCGRPYG